MKRLLQTLVRSVFEQSLLITFFLVSSTAFALTPEEKGLLIAKESEKKDLGWNDNESTAEMVLKNRQGQKSLRKMRRMVLEVTEAGFGDKSLVIFDSPRDIRGTVLLSHTKILKADDQWLFLPALKRVKRISSANKSGSFVGSEFAYEDLLSQEVEKYNYKWIREETHKGLKCAVVERYPLYENSAYTKQIVWWDLGEYRLQKIEFYDRKNSLLKTLQYVGYKKYKKKFWRPDKLFMVNHQNGKTTDIIFSKWEFTKGVDDSQFTPSRLKRMR